MPTTASTHLNRRSFLNRAAAIGLVAAFGATVTELCKPGKAEAYGWSRTLSQGSTGADVVELQIRVAGWAAASASQTYVGVGGDSGPGTAAAVRRFQSAYGLGCRRRRRPGIPRRVEQSGKRRRFDGALRLERVHVA